MKIAVLGYSGAGKSTLAGILAKHYNIPVLYLDSVGWTYGWQERGKEEREEIVREFMKNKSWVIDGNYKSLFRAERLEQADQIFILSFNRFFCLKSAFKRYFMYKGKTRPDMAKGCNEKIDLEFILWILFTGRTRKKRNDYKSVYNRYKSKTLWLTSRKQVNDYINSLNNSDIFQ